MPVRPVLSSNSQNGYYLNIAYFCLLSTFVRVENVSRHFNQEIECDTIENPYPLILVHMGYPWRALILLKKDRAIFASFMFQLLDWLFATHIIYTIFTASIAFRVLFLSNFCRL